MHFLPAKIRLRLVTLVTPEKLWLGVLNLGAIFEKWTAFDTKRNAIKGVLGELHS